MGRKPGRVAHEALVRNWPTLSNWLEKDREALRERQRLLLAAENWKARGEDPEALLRGSTLSDALRSSVDNLGQLEREFLRASLREKLRIEQEEEAARRHEIAQAHAWPRSNACGLKPSGSGLKSGRGRRGDCAGRRLRLQLFHLLPLSLRFMPFAMRLWPTSSGLWPISSGLWLNRQAQQRRRMLTVEARPKHMRAQQKHRRVSG